MYDYEAMFTKMHKLRAPSGAALQPESLSCVTMIRRLKSQVQVDEECDRRFGSLSLLCLEIVNNNSCMY